MPKGKKYGGKDFPKGVSGNPAGRPAATKELREALRDKRHEFITEAHRLFQLSGDELDQIAEDAKIPWLTAMLAKTMKVAWDKGCYMRFEFLVNQTMAALPKSVELSDGDGKPFRPLAEVPTDKLIEFFEALSRQKSP